MHLEEAAAVGLLLGRPSDGASMLAHCWALSCCVLQESIAPGVFFMGQQRATFT